MPLFTPIGGGGIGKATITSVTHPAYTVDTTSRPGKTIYKFTGGTGNITIGTAGTCEVLVVGGGGGSMTNGYGGAGAGGYIYKSSYFVAPGTHTVTVGAGGAGMPYTFSGPCNNGEDSVFSDLLALGGGGAAVNKGYDHIWNIRGGSGGGGNYNAGYGLGTPGQGYRGGNGNGSTYWPGGGGGAGGPGGDGTSVGGVGGIGIANSITGTSVTYAIGGQRESGTVAANRGLGGGGRGPSTGEALCSGGSGIVVVVIG